MKIVSEISSFSWREKVMNDSANKRVTRFCKDVVCRTLETDQVTSLGENKVI